GEMIPNDDTYCELDPRMVDRWGIPVLRFHWKWSDHEYKQVKHMQETFRALITEMGGEVFSPMPTAERGYGIAAGGTIIHELGGRVGARSLGAGARGARARRAVRSEELHRARMGDGAPARGPHHPQRRALGKRDRRRRARVHGLHAGRRSGPANADSRRPGLA